MEEIRFSKSAAFLCVAVTAIALGIAIIFLGWPVEALAADVGGAGRRPPLTAAGEEYQCEHVWVIDEDESVDATFNRKGLKVWHRTVLL